ncbi:MAG: hypothetical protein LYZ69_03475 [Nitrososphaerales archaeon]|nr:hypothetical protein [Nitrososphaerales archaeon]
MTDSETLENLLKKAMERPGVAVVMKLQEQYEPVLARTRMNNRSVATTSVSNSTS